MMFLKSFAGLTSHITRRSRNHVAQFLRAIADQIDPQPMKSTADTPIEFMTSDEVSLELQSRHPTSLFWYGTVQETETTTKVHGVLRFRGQHHQFMPLLAMIFQKYMSDSQELEQ